MFLILSVALVFLAAFATPAIARFIPHNKRFLFALVPISSCCLILTKANDISMGLHYSENYTWIPRFGIDLNFRLDGLSFLMALLITGIGALILTYASGYMKGHQANTRFYTLIFIFMAAMLGLVLSDNLIMMFIFWELTTVSSFLLVGFNHEDPEARKKALQALIVTAGGGLAMLAGILLLGEITGTYRISELIPQADYIRNHELYKSIVILFCLGAFTKSAQFPFHFWLPNAMAAPTPVSAYLHSATMVKAGVYLLARLTPVLGGTEFWLLLLVSVGGFTMLLSASLGLIYRDLKKILAYSTLSVLGIITLLIGMGTEFSYKAAIMMLFAHALYKATLFMVAGSIDHEVGTRDINRLSGLRKVMPWTFAAAALAALSQAGFPPFTGFLAKEYFYGSALDHPMQILLIISAFISSMFLFVLAFKIGFHPFLGPLNKKLEAHEAPVTMLIGPLCLAFLSLLFGLFPSPIAKYILSPALASFTNDFHPVKLKLWHGVNTALILSLITLTCGFILYALRKKIRKNATNVDDKMNIQFDQSFAKGLDYFLKFAKWQTRLVQSGSLRTYMIITISAFAGLLLYILLYVGGMPKVYTFTHVKPITVAFVVALIIVTVVTCTTLSRLTALLSLGVIGFGITLIYMFYGAPDLAITQILVETLTVVMFMVVIHKLPKFKDFSNRRKKIFDAIFATGVGTTITFLVIKAQSLTLAAPVSLEYAQKSYLEAHGRNVVNVILVDFRAFDTFGEITVLTIAGLGVMILMRKSKDEESQP
ncbi:putative monovalent cation/H+ antiporter subunit A [Lentisphaera profundi]|uniref:Monovalent cation/H+ antiporter subunit A n=1 Tax=Lentisphaera profundi TaxID=1658616 RepID=A0ABY7VMZ5_9BACT|nr:putative monovalent cation/H+ antiporter subunit A [Lentisphaera profundi]WDE95448.1 putative monovalent cation/H+ antiporter subunit A [Lentisphaera profundi]